MGLVSNLRDARRIAAQETDERVQIARLQVARDVLVAVVAVCAAALVAGLLLGTVLPVPTLPARWWLVLTPFGALYVGLAVACISTQRRRATTAELERARRARLMLTAPLVAPVTFLLVFVVGHDLSEALYAAIAATAGIALTGLVGYRRWTGRGR